MSFDIFLSCVRDGEPSTFKRALAHEILAKGASDADESLEEISYPDGGAEVFCDEADDVDGISFNHAGGATFFERLWELADRTGSMIFWPGGGQSVAVTRADMLPHLPEDLPGGDGSPAAVVGNAKALEDLIGRSG